MHPILFSIGKISFYTYGLFVSLAFIFSVLVFYYLARKRNLWQENTLNKLLLTFVFIIIFARLGYFLTYYHKYYNNWWEIFSFWQGGLVSYGGILGLIIGVGIFFRKNFLVYLDLVGISALVAGIFWRIGGIMAGSYPTFQSNSFLTIKEKFPAIELEIVFLSMGFILFGFIYQKKILKDGMMSFILLFYYGFLRFMLDSWRDLLEGFSIFNIGQLFGLVLMIISIFTLIILALKNNNSQSKSNS